MHTALRSRQLLPTLQLPLAAAAANGTPKINAGYDEASLPLVKSDEDMNSLPNADVAVEGTVETGKNNARATQSSSEDDCSGERYMEDDVEDNVDDEVEDGSLKTLLRLMAASMGVTHFPSDAIVHVQGWG